MEPNVGSNGREWIQGEQDRIPKITCDFLSDGTSKEQLTKTHDRPDPRKLTPGSAIPGLRGEGGVPTQPRKLSQS